MTGLEKIIGEIKSESDAAVRQITEEANKEAEKIRADARKNAQEEAAKIRAASEARVADASSRAESSAQLVHRRALLEEKQRLISEVVEAAKTKALAFDDATYFDSILKVLGKNVQAGDGTIRFSKKDLARIPADFEKKMKDTLPAGSRLSLDKTPVNIQGGFVLSYGGVEENCSFDAIFESKADELFDLVKKILFEG